MAARVGSTYWCAALLAAASLVGLHGGMPVVMMLVVAPVVIMLVGALAAQKTVEVPVDALCLARLIFNLETSIMSCFA